MTDKENNFRKLKNRLKRLQNKIQDRVEDFQDQMQHKIDEKLSRLLSDDKSSCDGSIENDAEKSSSDSTDYMRNISIPSLVVDEPNDPKEICKDFLTIERNGVLYRRCVSTSNLMDDNSNNGSSSDLCFSCFTSIDDRAESRPRAGSLPPSPTLNRSGSACADLIEKIGNKFPGLISKGDRIHRVPNFVYGYGVCM